MRRNNKTRFGTGKKLAYLLTAFLALGPALHILPYHESPVRAASAVTPLVAPYVKKPIPDLTAGTGKTLTLDLMQYFDTVDHFTATAGGLEGFDAQVNGSLLTLTGGGTGTATVTVTGKNGSYTSVTGTFDVSVVPETLDQDHNNKIELGEVAAYLNTHQTIRPAVNLMLGTVSPHNVAYADNIPPRAKAAMLSVEKNSSLTINPGTLFDDNDQLTLETYKLSPTGLVSVLSADSHQLTLVGLQQGIVTLDATASDGRGGKAGSRYTVSVTDAKYNNVPYWNNSLGTVTVTRDTYLFPAIELRQAFTDMDGDPFQFNPVSVSGNTVEVEQHGGLLNIYGKNQGTSTVTATVYDGRGGIASGTFKVLVDQAPLLSGDPIPSRSLPYNHSAHIRASNRFWDPDGDPLIYSAWTTGGPLTLETWTSGRNVDVDIHDLPMGTHTVTLKAEDIYGLSVTDTFVVEVFTPMAQ